MGHFIVKKEFSNEDKGQKTKYQVSDMKIDDSKFPKSRLTKWEKLGWIEWTR
jgi:hypothetical protein